MFNLRLNLDSPKGKPVTFEDSSTPKRKKSVSFVKPSFLSLKSDTYPKPLSLNFRLFGNIVADELTVSVLCSLVPILIPVPIMVLGLFASSIQALIFSTLAGAYIHEALE